MPVLVLTARSEEGDRILAFRLGVDDYVTKPFNMLELILRIKVLLRRAPHHRANGGGEALPYRIRLGEIEIDLNSRSATRSGCEVPIPPKQYELLVALVRRDGRTASRLELLRDVCGHRGAVTTRTVDYHISESRKRIEPDPSHPRHIPTVDNMGYRVRVD